MLPLSFSEIVDSELSRSDSVALVGLVDTIGATLSLSC